MTGLTETSFPELEDLGSASAFVEDIEEIVRGLSIFDGFSRQESALLCEYMECFGARSQSAILRESEAGDFLVIILTGGVKIVKHHAQGGDALVCRLGPGDIVGEMSLFDGRQRFASCITTEPTDFAVLTRSSLNDILVDHPRLGNKLLLIMLQSMTARLRDTTTRLLPSLVGPSI